MPDCQGCHYRNTPQVCQACRKDAAGGALPSVSGAPKLKTKAIGRQVHARGKMNSTERAYAEFLELRKIAGNVSAWWFEAITLKLGPDCRLTMDFLVQLPDGTMELHDTKGRKKTTKKDGSVAHGPLIEDDARVKLSVAAGMYPFVIRTAFKLPNGEWCVEEIS